MRTEIAAFARACVVVPLTAALAQAPAELGRAVDAAIAWERQHAAAVSDMDLGDYHATAIISPAESWYEWRVTSLELHQPPPDTVHVKVILRDSKDGRIVPGLSIRGSFISRGRTEMLQKPMPFGWYPVVNGYAENFPAAEAGLYHLRIEIKPATYPRHNRELGRRYRELLRGEFPPILLNPAALRGREPLTGSDEGAPFAKAQGTALDAALQQFWGNAMGGAESESGDYRVACVANRVEGYWYEDQGKLKYRSESQMGDRNTEISVIVRDAQTGRFLPGLDVSVAVRDRVVLGTAPEGFMWDPVLNHYGENWQIPRTGGYAVTVRIEAPKWRRYGKQAGRRFASNAVVEFAGVHMESSDAKAP